MCLLRVFVFFVAAFPRCLSPSTTLNAEHAEHSETAEHLVSVRSAISALVVRSCYLLTSWWPGCLLTSQRLNRIESRRLHCGIEAEKQADERRHADAERNRPHFELGGDRR